MSSPDSCSKTGESCPLKSEIKSFVYWRKPLRSALVLVTLLVVQLSFVCFSAISILAYAGAMLFLLVNLCRLYYHYIAKAESQFIKDYFEHDIQLPKDRIGDVTGRLTDMSNNLLNQARDIILLTNVGASVKFGILLYIMTYVGACFNFLTLCIIATLIAFSVPKFYESYQSEIDRGFKVVKDKVNNVWSKAYKQISTKLESFPLIGSRKAKTQ